MATHAERLATVPDRDETAAIGDLAVARNVLALEASGLKALAEALDGDFERSLDRLEAVTGRIIVSGMGKSGHVARKIAATLASTGSPAQYVHPGEASHGDLGMITGKDAVIAMSHSGQTRELGDLVAYTRRFEIPLIAITGKRNSPLAERADHALILPEVREACPMGLAPTTSTTMALGLGDALAIALLERRGFSTDDFQVFHPGGALGSKLLKVLDIMHGSDELPLCSADDPMPEAVETMSAKSFGCVGIVDDSGNLTGIITDGDLRRNIGKDLRHCRAGEVMTHAPETIRPQALAAEALRIMNMRDRPCTSLFVVEEARPVGIIHIHDCLRSGVA